MLTQDPEPIPRKISSDRAGTMERAMQSPSAVRALDDMAESSCGWYWSWSVVEIMTPELGFDVFMLQATATAKESAQSGVGEPEYE